MAGETCRLLMTFAGRKAHIYRPLAEAASRGRVVAADADPEAPVRAVARHFEVVPPVSRRDAYLEALLDLCRRHEIDAVMSVNDMDVGVLVEARERFAEVGTKVLGTSARLTRILCDKWEAARWLEERGFRPVPTWRAESPPRDLPFPLAAKPRSGQGSRGLRRCEVPEDLEGLPEDGGLPEDYVLQPWLEGEHYDLDVLQAEDGSVCAVVPKRKLEMTDGTASRVLSADGPDLVALGERLAGDLGFLGAFDVDVVVSRGEVYVLEINPRLGGCFPFACRILPELPQALLAVARGETPEPLTGRRRLGITVARELAFVEVPDATAGAVSPATGETAGAPGERWRIAVPCFNEELGLEPTVADINALADRVPEMDVEIVMIDDASTDRTREIMERLCERFPRCRMRINPRNLGPGGSVMSLWDETDPDSWFSALPGDNEIVATSMLQHAAVRRDHDLVIGYLQNPIIRPLRRRIGSAVFGALVRTAYAFPFHYLNGPKLYRVWTFQGLDVVAGGHAFNAELMAKALLRRPELRIAEVPFTARGRAAGSSKAFTPRNILRAVREFYLGYRSVSSYRAEIIKK